GVPVYSLDWPVEHSYDLRTFAEQLLRNVNISQSQSVSLVSLDQHKVLDAVDIAQARSIFSLLGDLHDAALLVCSYAPEGSGNRRKTYNFVQSVSRYTAQSVSLVHTSAKIFGPRAKAAFLDALFTEAGNILDPLPLTIWHFDDSGDIVQAIERLGNSRIRARQWDGSRSQRYSLLEHIRFELGL
ncbi:dbo, partial [Symbiodinium sp. CCMP2592]